MPNIGVIDDRPDIRSTLVQNINLELEDDKDWRVTESAPLDDVKQYPSWIVEHSVAALVVDERLGEQARPGRGAVAYAGHDVVAYLRRTMPTLPIFVVTAHADDEVLQGAKPDVEDVVPREKFNAEPGTYVARIVRAGQRYTEEYERELAELTEISRRMVLGQASDEDVRRASAIREFLSRAPDERETSTRSQWLERVKAQLDDLEGLKKEIQNKIKAKSRGKSVAKKKRKKKAARRR